jgi:hypothetical protein
MKQQLAKQESILPPGYRLQVIKNVEGFLETVPIGTNQNISYMGGLPYRERMAKELRELFCETYGFESWGNKEVMTICAEIEGNECVWCRARIAPRKRIKTRIEDYKDTSQLLRLEGGDPNIIDI